jgi:hypothetical protein
MVLCSCHRGRETLSPSGARASAGRCPMQVALFKDAPVDRHRSANHDILICRPAPSATGCAREHPPARLLGGRPLRLVRSTRGPLDCHRKRLWQHRPTIRASRPRAGGGSRGHAERDNANPRRQKALLLLIGHGVMIALHAAVDAGARPITSSSRPPTVLPADCGVPLGRTVDEGVEPVHADAVQIEVPSQPGSAPRTPAPVGPPLAVLTPEGRASVA